MSRYQQDNQRHGVADQQFPGGEARVPVIAVREDLLRAVTDAARTTGAVTVCCDTTQLAERWPGAAVVVLDEPAAAELLVRYTPLGSRSGRPTVLLYAGRVVDMPDEDVAALWEAADALEATHVLPHGDWLDEPAAAAWAGFLGATLAAGSVPLQADEYDHGAGRDGRSGGGR